MPRLTVRKEVTVRCSVERAFAVFTEQIDAWWPPGHRRLSASRIVLDPLGPEGRLVETDGEQTLEIGFVSDWTPPDRLQMGWRLGAPAPLFTVVTVHFTPLDGATRVEVIHEDGVPPLPDFPTTARRFDAAWSHVLSALQQFIGANPTEES
jgi:uncharacterized protein YndB with AHSA1/START domain